MGSPYFDFGEDLGDNRFLELFSRFGGSTPEFGQYLEPNDSQVQDYQKLANSPTGSENLISDYVNRRPMYEDYKPSLGRKLAAVLIGGLSGNPTTAYGLAQKHVNDPYQRQLEDWKGEGTSITARARLLDAERSRELGAAKYGLQQKSSTLRAKSVDEAKRAQEARRLATQTQDEEQQEQARADRLEQQDWRKRMSEDVFGLRKEMYDYRKDQDTLRNEDRDTTERRLQADSDRRKQEDQLEASTKRLQAENSAKELAFRRAKSNPAFSDLLEFDEGSRTWQLNDENPGGPERVKLLKMYIQRLMDNNLKGKFE